MVTRKTKKRCEESWLKGQAPQGIYLRDISEAQMKKEIELTPEQRQTAKDFKEVFGSECGKRALEKLKTRYSYDTIVWKRDTLGRIDPYDVTKRAAQRAVINFIVNQIEQKL
jgi:hypothetical protein